MFYIKDSFDDILRFGDVIRGFQYFLPNFDGLPYIVDTNINIEIIKSDYFVVLTPCCSIENSFITLTPLKQLRYQFFSNPFFVEDFTVINRKMLPQNAVAPSIWERFEVEERNKRIQEGPKYSFAEVFIYGSDELLPTYELSYKGNPRVQTGYYMIDFKEAFTIKSNKIIKNMRYPKILQLTIESREELRCKIGEYFSRVPVEDQVARL